MARVQGAEAVYEAANAFRERCLVSRASLLWPDCRPWTPENIDGLLEAYIDNPVLGNRSFVDKWKEQLANEPDDVLRVAADAQAVYFLHPKSSGNRSKLKAVAEVCSWRPESLRMAAAEHQMLEVAFARGIGKVGTFYNINKPNEIAFILRFAREIMQTGTDPRDANACKAIADRVRAGDTISTVARHAILHLLFPDHFEPIVSEVHKRKIVETFREEAKGEADLDDALADIRKVFEQRFGRNGFSFYDSEIEKIWNPTHPDPDPDVPQPQPTPPTPSSIQDVAARTFMDVAELRELEALLIKKGQIVLEGPPGSGKTFVADLLARYLTDNPLEGPHDQTMQIVQFHQSYGYEDFIQGIRPLTIDGGLQYQVVPGIFLQISNLARDNPDRPFVLIVDEINRGNISRIFGELMLLLEYREKNIRLPNHSGATSDSGDFSIPKNLYLIGTMNSTDRSLALIDYALRRRFYFKALFPIRDGSAPVLARWLAHQGMPEQVTKDRLDLFLALNAGIANKLPPEFQVGHSYFMTDDIGTQEGLDRVWRHAIMPLLIEYFHNHSRRDQILEEFSTAALLSTVALSLASELLE